MDLLPRLFRRVQKNKRKTIALACPEDTSIMNTIASAVKLKIADFILFTKSNQIKFAMPKMAENIEIVECGDKESSCREAVKAVSMGKATVLMKGLVDTSIFLKHILNRDYGLKNKSLLSHIMICGLCSLKRTILLSDGGLNINPDTSTLTAIAVNAIKLAKCLGISHPKTALLSAVEKINPKIPSSVKCHEAMQAIKKLNMKNSDVYGPLSLDVALCKTAASTKKIDNPVVGAADILIAPSIEVANTLYKGWMFGCKGNISAGIVMGAKAPVILSSRADTVKTKLYSIALALYTINGVSNNGLLYSRN